VGMWNQKEGEIVEGRTSLLLNSKNNQKKKKIRRNLVIIPRQIAPLSQQEPKSRGDGPPLKNRQQVKRRDS